MKAFVTGVGGQLGHDVMNELAKRGYEGIGSDILPTIDTKYPYVQLDITDGAAVEKAISEVKPDVVIHCAAWTAVDAAEDEENKPKASIIGNIMAGMVMTYMRPFRVGDYIKIGDTVGEVIEKTLLVTRIRTRKNEVVTIQNSSLMGSQTSNFTVAAQTYGLIVHTKVTIGYDVPWQLVKSIMESAAADTPGLKKNPKPFMMTTSLDDFYVEYEINAFTSDAVHLPRIYCDLHQNLLRRFFEAGVEIMSPHIYARRDGIDLQMPKEFTDSSQEGSTSPAKGV